MKILHVITALNYGGAEAMLAKLVRQHRAVPGLPEPTVVSLMPLGEVGLAMAADRVKVESLGLRRAWQLPQAMVRLASAVRRHQPDIVQGWMYHGNLAASAVARFAPSGKALLWNVRHSLNAIHREKLSSRAVIAAGALLSRQPQAIIYNSAAAVEQHVGHGYASRRAIVIPNGFDTDLFVPDGADRAARRKLYSMFGIEDGVVVVAMVARRHPMKDHESAIEAAGMARKMGHDVHLLLAGDGTEALPANLVRAYRRCLPMDRLTLLGDRRDVAQWLPGCDIALLSSAWGEGFPNVLGEAMAAGLPCVATDVGDSAAIIGATGFCVAAGDRPAMAAALARLCEMGTEGRRAFGSRGRARVLAEYSLAAVADRYLRLYDSTIAAPGTGKAQPEVAACAE